jgi:streptogramin lyase
MEDTVIPGKHTPRHRIARLALTLLIALSVAPLAAGLRAPAAVGAATVIDVYPIPTAGGSPYSIAAGSDGALWFTEFNGNKIGRITTEGVITNEYPVPTAGSVPYGITTGPDGNVWFVQQLGNKVGRVTPSGAITEFPIPTFDSAPLGITSGPDGALWFTEGRNTSNKIGRMTTAGVVTGEYPLPTAGAQPANITAGPDGNLWFTEQVASKIGRITPGGTITEFPTPTPNAIPTGIAAGPDGNLWFTLPGVNKIGRITPAGVITEFAIPTAGSTPIGISAGPDGALWFTERESGKIGRITTTGVVTEHTIPGAGRKPVHITHGPDGNLWFTLQDGGGNAIGRVRPNAPTPATITTQPVTGGTYSILTPAPYTVGQTITAVASPNPGFIFAGWVGAGLISDKGVGVISDNGLGLRPPGASLLSAVVAPATIAGDGLVTDASGLLPSRAAAPVVTAAATPTLYPLGPWNPTLNATITDADAKLRPLFLERPSFSDVPAGYRAEETIEQLAARGIIRGYQADVCAERGLTAPCFGPEDRVLRAQMAALIARAMFWDAENWDDVNFPDQGTVDADLWRNVRTLAHYKVALGYDDGTYNPTGDVLYVQTVLFISRAMVARGYWTLQPDSPDLYTNIPGETARQKKDRQDIATYVHYAGALPDIPAGPGQPFTNFDQPATREWFTRALYQAVDSYFGR